MQGIQPVASIVPYVTAVGNHEEAYNFSHYRHRFSGYNLAAAASGALPDLNWWYSWDYMSGGARVHMVSISSEVYYFWLEEDLLPAVAMQFEWLKKDLAAARGSADWVIAYTHRVRPLHPPPAPGSPRYGHLSVVHAHVATRSRCIAPTRTTFQTARHQHYPFATALPSVTARVAMDWTRC